MKFSLAIYINIYTIKFFPQHVTLEVTPEILARIPSKSLSASAQNGGRLKRRARLLRPPRQNYN